PSLKADSRHSWTDVIASSGIVAGILLQIMGIEIMDALTALLISLFLAWSGFTVILEGLKVLLDASIEKEILQKVRSIVEADPRVRRIVSTEGRNSGSYRFLEISLIPRQYDLKGDSKLALDLEQSIKERIEKVDSVTVDLAVEGEGTALCAVPIMNSDNLIARGIEDAGYFELIEVEQNGFSITSRERIEKPSEEEETATVRAAAFLARLGLNILVIRDADINASPYWILDECGVKIVSMPGVAVLSDFENSLPEILSNK
ncbi:MAG: cation transporter, partial [Actinobacteria bacterium]|nr:cation transporter [Actinomycetota bacterium]